ncbi:hypothetical protein WG902_14375 [Ramlibacter sp. PS3R-8]|uniref:hypothetical protein n=1 Tax=Ramlibacter sp. PS3R-8 TaxID=3133437 RepID=UPI0030AF9354
MDYRHTEDFARRMEAEALHGRALRRQAIDAFWADMFAAMGRGLRALRGRLSGASRNKNLLPEA